MAFANYHDFPPAAQSLAHIGEIIAHPARQIILNRLLQAEDWLVAEVVTQDIPLHPSTISQHIRKLRRVGVVESRNTGRSTEHRIDPEHQMLAELLEQVIKVADQFAEVLEDPSEINALQRATDRKVRNQQAQ